MTFLKNNLIFVSRRTNTMNADIIKCLNHLLYEQEYITISSFGSFEIKQVSAVIDPISGKIHPPTGEAAFNPSIQSDNQQLKLALISYFGYSDAEAATEITSFVREMKAKLEQKEIVYLEGIGKLFLDHEELISFLPTTINHTRGNYGLPDVAFSSITKGERAPKKEVEIANESKAKEKTNKKGMMPLVMGSFAIIAFGVFFAVKQYISTHPAPDVAQVVHLNQKPSILPSPVPFMEEIANLDTEEKSTEQHSRPAIEVEDELSVQETKARTLKNNECVIIAGNFTSRKNAKKMIRDLVQKGYAPFNDKKGKRYRVGVIFQYDSVYEIKDKLENLSDTYHTSAWILKK